MVERACFGRVQRREQRDVVVARIAQLEVLCHLGVLKVLPEVELFRVHGTTASHDGAPKSAGAIPLLRRNAHHSSATAGPPGRLAFTNTSGEARGKYQPGSSASANAAICDALKPAAKKGAAVLFAQAAMAVALCVGPLSGSAPGGAYIAPLVSVCPCLARMPRTTPLYGSVSTPLRPTLESAPMPASQLS